MTEAGSGLHARVTSGLPVRSQRPPRAEQERIVAELDRARSTLDAPLVGVQHDRTRIDRLRQSVLKWAFEGTLIQDPADEPASVLLARIKAAHFPRKRRRHGDLHRAGAPRARLRDTLTHVDAMGAYTADRAAALSGVPKTTIHWWARKGILEPTVSATKVRLWSYADLMGLRVIYWLRRGKTTDGGVDIPGTSMPAVRRAIDALRALDLPLWHTKGPTLYVDSSGTIYVNRPEGPATAAGQRALDAVLDLIAPFTTAEGTRGPDLVTPRPDLRIVPGKVSGSPHIADTRLETRALAALTADGFDVAAIHELYPYVAREHIEQALDLEAQLAENLRRAA